MKKLARFLTRYWGYIALLLTILGYFGHHLALTATLALSLAAFGYFLVQAPVWCCDNQEGRDVPGEFPRPAARLLAPAA
jgi:hypothetical protein